MPGDYFIQSARLGFRRWREEDLPLAHELWSNAQVTGWFGGPFSREQVLARFTGEIAQERVCGLQLWPVFLLENGRHVGCTGLRPWRPEEKIPELGFHFHPAYWGRGLATEAALAVIDYAFTVLGSSAVFAGHHPENEPSRKTLTKLGFVYEGDEFYAPSGMIEPTYLLRRPVPPR